MELADLVGTRELSGVDFGTLPPDRANYQYEDAQTMTFVLDGHAYCVIEDPSDGYRSSMGDVCEVPIESVKNRFAPVAVIVSYIGRREHTYGEQCDILEIRDARTGKLVLEAGTENSDDYYPSFVANFTPEHMAINNEAR